MTFESTSSVFKSQVRNLRYSLSQQLQQPTLISGNICLISNTLSQFIQRVVDSLNSGQAVLPSSAYVTMMTQELQGIIGKANGSLDKVIDQEIKHLEGLLEDCIRDSSKVVAVASSRNEYISNSYDSNRFYSAHEAYSRIRNILNEFYDKTIQEIHSTINYSIVDDSISGSHEEDDDYVHISSKKAKVSSVSKDKLKPSMTLNNTNTLASQVLAKVPETFLIMLNRASDYYMTSYREILSRYLIQRHKLVENELNQSIDMLCKSSDDEGLTVSEIDVVLQNLLQKAKADVGYGKYWPVIAIRSRDTNVNPVSETLLDSQYKSNDSDGVYIKVAIDSIEKVIENRKSVVYQHHATLIEKQNEKYKLLITNIVNASVSQMKDVLYGFFSVYYNELGLSSSILMSTGYNTSQSRPKPIDLSGKPIDVTKGLTLSICEQYLNQQFLRIKTSIESQYGSSVSNKLNKSSIQLNPTQLEQVIVLFQESCSKLRPTMVDLFNELQTQIINILKQQGLNEMDLEYSMINDDIHARVVELVSSDNSIDYSMSVNEFKKGLLEVSSNITNEVLSQVVKWDTDEVKESQLIIKPLQNHADRIIEELLNQFNSAINEAAKMNENENETVGAAEDDVVDMMNIDEPEYHNEQVRLLL